MVRRALSRYSEIPPQKWRFVENAHGKPLIDPDLDSPPLSFSLAHTKGLAVVAVTGGADVGVDVERADRSVNAARLTGRFFSPEETAALQELSPERLRERFFLYWTLKESYIKARGLGLSLPLDSFSFRLAGEIPFRIRFNRMSKNTRIGQAVEKCTDARRAKTEERGIGDMFRKPSGIGTCPRNTSSDEVCSATQQMGVFQQPVNGSNPNGPRGWRFALLRPLPQYVAAVGISSARPNPVRIRCFHTLPSGEISLLNIEFVGLSPGVEIS
jgi:hypothetical protein